MKRIIKSMLGMLLLVVVVLGLSLNAYALTQTRSHIIDNDDAQGYTNDRYGFDTLFQASTLYYQDARRQVCNANNNQYQYIFPEITSLQPINVQISAYLYHTSFTDPAALYGINTGLDLFFSYAGTINQDLAAPGWNVIETAKTHLSGHIGGGSGGIGFSTYMVVVEPSHNNPGKYCGADAIKAVATYQ